MRGEHYLHATFITVFLCQELPIVLLICSKILIK